jgi:hypothetical protein
MVRLVEVSQHLLPSKNRPSARDFEQQTFEITMSMEGSKFLMKDLRPEPSRPIEEIEKERANLIKRARRELKVITPPLKELVAKIESEKPDLGNL